jgi:signal transduction histidine kinase
MKTAESILNTLHQPVLVLDGTLQTRITNPAFFRAFGLGPTDSEADFIEAFVSGNACAPPLRTTLAPLVIDGKEIEEVETLCTLPTGRRVFLLVNAQRIRMAGLPEMILVEPRDITREKTAEQCIQELNNALQEHVAAVDAVNQELESYSHSVSHDLRTPLRFVNRVAHLLLYGPGADLSTAAAEQVNMILQATGEMGRLIENLLVFSQAARVPIKKRRLDLRRLFQDVVRELQHAQKGSVAEIDIQELALCQGDRTLLKEVAVNLLTNAVKFTRRRESARITVGCAETDGEAVYFVRDNGVGFDMNDSDLLFVPFHRLHKTADFEGTGIGLALVKRIIERHGGRIWAEGEVDKGATFHFTLGKDTVE